MGWCFFIEHQCLKQGRISTEWNLVVQGEEKVKAEPQGMLEALLQAGADARLVKLSWVANSLRWTMWKLVSLASQHEARRQQLLTFPVVLDELKKRYRSHSSRNPSKRTDSLNMLLQIFFLQFCRHSSLCIMQCSMCFKLMRYP